MGCLLLSLPSPSLCPVPHILSQSLEQMLGINSLGSSANLEMLAGRQVNPKPSTLNPKPSTLNPPP